MTKIFIFLSLTLFLACNFSIDPRNAGDDERNDEQLPRNDLLLYYTVSYQESDKTMRYSAHRSTMTDNVFLAGNELMTLENPQEPTHTYLQKDVEPADFIETSVTFRSKEGDIVSEFSIPRVTIEEIPVNVSRATGFEVKLGGEAIEKGDFIDLELYDPETKESVAVYSLQPSIPGMENTVSVDGQSLKITSGFMEWFSEFESGKTYLLSINRSPGGWSKEKNLDYTVNYQIKYSSALHPITVAP